MRQLWTILAATLTLSLAGCGYNTFQVNDEQIKSSWSEVLNQYQRRADGVWDTEHNNGLLVYLLLADRAVEIVADRGIHAKVGAPEWEKICRKMETAFKQADYEGGVVRGLQAVTQHLMQHFPASGVGQNELPDKPVML